MKEIRSYSRILIYSQYVNERLNLLPTPCISKETFVIILKLN